MEWRWVWSCKIWSRGHFHGGNVSLTEFLLENAILSAPKSKQAHWRNMISEVQLQVYNLTSPKPTQPMVTFQFWSIGFQLYVFSVQRFSDPLSRAPDILTFPSIIRSGGHPSTQNWAQNDPEPLGSIYYPWSIKTVCSRRRWDIKHHVIDLDWKTNLCQHFPNFFFSPLTELTTGAH